MMQLGPEFCFKLKDRQMCVLLCAVCRRWSRNRGLRRLQLYRQPHSFVVQSINIQLKMKTSSALLLACAGSAAAFAPQASNKVRHAEKVFAKEEEEGR